MVLEEDVSHFVLCVKTHLGIATSAFNNVDTSLSASLLIMRWYFKSEYFVLVLFRWGMIVQTLFKAPMAAIFEVI